MVLATPPVSKGGNAGGCFMDQYQQYSAHCETADSGNGSDLESTGVPTKPDDSEESGPSSLGSDSMHGSSTEYVRQSASQPSGQRQRQKSLRVLGALLPDSLLRDIRDRRGTEYVVTFSQPEDEEKNQIPEQIPEKPGPFRLARESLSEEKIEELRAAVERANFVQTGEETLDSIDATSQSLPASNNISGHRSNINYKYADDQYYSFHINEHENFSGFSRNGDEADSSRGAGSEGRSESGILTEQQDLFAGYRDVRCGASSTQSTIRSAKGTVRGVKNRVRNGIATFLQLQQQPNAKNFKEKDLGKVVLYTTSMGIIRETYTKCANVKQILRTLLVKFEERDVFMSVEYQAEMRQRMQSGHVRVPQLYVEGQHIGDAETVERLNESGELRQLLKPYKSMASTFTCQTCGGYRLLPCPSCNGSKKSVHRNHFTAEFVALKCMNCDEVGLVKCHSC
ncbi:LOW QUALITY PROTEIN: glutaredoxin domain-containing cysteine-rich protein CG31559 [Drosophila eugracilis]|uniref:LOW QUALITY PROTEIN: glutaredoxin domain-containing cysteine-rich protein CG31559 n=1 Tax=Drosophila eugracilis TaxID=29029 RepID=UPI0007E89078|nr:LOW QUALITY PROTEIN: glutaredoxin domain-containing cysteine-rich protein CG31559 [Drosophila eugracilis]